jgi:hypothetical protein
MYTIQNEGSERDDPFLKLVDFKWLMAGVGWWVDLSRLRRDKAYVDECLQRARESGSELLQKCSVELRGLQLCPNPHRDAAMCE